MISSPASFTHLVLCGGLTTGTQLHITDARTFPLFQSGFPKSIETHFYELAEVMLDSWIYLGNFVVAQ